MAKPRRKQYEWIRQMHRSSLRLRDLTAQMQGGMTEERIEAMRKELRRLDRAADLVFQSWNLDDDERGQ